MHNIQSLRLHYVWSRYKLNFYKKKKKKNTVGKFVGGGNGESMTVLVGAAVLVGKFLHSIRDSSQSSDSSSHIEKMPSTSRASARERKSNQRKKRKNKWKRKDREDLNTLKFSYKIFQSCLEINQSLCFTVFFEGYWEIYKF